MKGDKKTKGKSPKPQGVRKAQRNITEAVQSQAERQQSSELHQAIIASATEGICACHDVPEFPYVRFTVWNQRMIEITGYTMEEINTGGWYQTVYPDPEIQARAKTRMDRMRQGDNLNQEEWEITQKDGQRRHLLISTRIVPGGETGVNVLVVMNDITERKRAEETLRESEQRFRRLVDSNIIGVIIANIERIIQANDIFLQMIGYTRDELQQGMINWPSMTPIEHAAADKKGLEEMLSRGFCTPFEKEYLRKDGSRVPFLIGASMLTREPLTWICFVLDLTERKRAEEEMAQVAHEWQITFDASYDAIWILDQDQRVLRSNKAAERFFQRPCNELIGKHCWEIVHGTSQPIPECPILRARNSLRRESMEL